MPDQRDEFEAYLEAALIFGRTTIHHLRGRFSNHLGWDQWFDSLRGNEAVEFFRQHRDFALKEGMPHVAQRISFDHIAAAAELYSFESDIPATSTVTRHLAVISSLAQDAERRFAAD